MRKSYLVGYYGMKNIGDDALMNVAAWGAKECLHSDEISISSPIPLKLCSGEAVPAKLSETKRFPGHIRFQHYANAIDSKRIIFGGGSVLHNANDIDLKRDLMTLCGGRSHLAVGVGLGPFKNVKAEKSCAKFLSTCEFVGLRDKQSYDIARAIAPKANVDLTFDLAPQLLMQNGFKLRDMERQGVAVCMCPHERLKGDVLSEHKRLKRLASALDKIHLQTNETIYFVDFNGHAELGDEQVHLELASMLAPTTPFKFIKYDSNPLRSLQRMGTFKLAIGMRLHAAIFSFIAQTPFLSLNYHRKCMQWCEQIGAAKDYVFDVEDLDPAQIAKAASEGINHGFTAPQMTVNTAVGLSMKNWRISYDFAKQDNFFSGYSALQQA